MIGLRTKWTEEEIEFAIKKHGEGYSAGITADFFRKEGLRKDCATVTRNAIIGIWARHRDRLNIPEKSITKRNEQSPEYQNERKRTKHEVCEPSFHLEENMNFLKPEVETVERTTIANLKRNSCRFPFDDPRTENFHYCGEPVDYSKGKSYCTFHHQVCYRAPGEIR